MLRRDSKGLDEASAVIATRAILVMLGFWLKMPVACDTNGNAPPALEFINPRGHLPGSGLPGTHAQL